MKPTLAEPRRGPGAAVRLRNWQLLAPFRTALGRAVRRRAVLADHLGRLLFGLLNPGLKSQRAPSAASGQARGRVVRGRVVRGRSAARPEELRLATDLGPEVSSGELGSRL